MDVSIEDGGRPALVLLILLINLTHIKINLIAWSILAEKPIKYNSGYQETIVPS